MAGFVLADGGIETRIIYEFRRTLPDFAAFTLLRDEAGRSTLDRIYTSYATVAARHGLPIQLGTPTWRASRRWTSDVASVNREATALLRGVVARTGARAIVAGVLGPSHDGYDPNAADSQDQAYRYHREQAAALASSGVDLLYAPTFPALGELHGVARAMAETGLPYALAPMLHPDGTMLDGTPLDAAIERIDAAVSPAPLRYLIGCLYPTHARTALEATRARRPACIPRVQGLKANASPLPPEELDKLDRLASTPPQQFASDLWACAREFGLTVLGGCCGTDARHIEAVADLLPKA